MFVFFIPGPLLNLEEYISPGSLHAPLSISTEISSIGNVAHLVKESELCPILLAGYYAWADNWTNNSQLIDGCCYKYPVARKSEAEVRWDESQFFGNANLIIHHSLTNIIHPIIKFLCVLCQGGPQLKAP